MNLFEKASRLKLRFESVQGLLSTEELWDLPFETTRTNRADLQGVATVIHKQLKESDEVDFINESSTKNTELNLKMDIVKHIIKTKKEERAGAIQTKAIKAHNESIDEIIAQKQIDNMKNMSIEELQALKK